MKISRFITVAVFGLGLISQNSFSYNNVDQNNKIDHKRMKHHDKVTCERSVLPLFNEKENRTLICKDETTVKHARKHEVNHERKHEVNHERKHARKHNLCGKDCHTSILPLFNEKENRPCVCPNADENMTNKTNKTMDNGMTKAVAKK